jgi:hypothetical protein
MNFKREIFGNVFQSDKWCEGSLWKEINAWVSDHYGVLEFHSRKIAKKIFAIARTEMNELENITAMALLRP